MNTIARRVWELEQSVISKTVTARSYDYRQASDEAWVRFCRELNATMDELLSYIDAEEDPEFLAMNERIVTEMMKKPREFRYN